MDESIGPGDLVGDKYRVECVLASSEQATLLAVWDEVLERPLAVKLLPAVREPRSVARFTREARSAAKLESEHVIRIIDVGTLPTGMPFMVLERLDGFDLGELLERDGAIAPSRIADYMLQVCEGLAHAHAIGIVHRDIKPQNLFLAARADGVTLVKIVDFGIAKAHGEPVTEASLTSTYSLLGSPSYMSPEQIETPKNVDGRADIWSLGVVMYKLATGRAPFTGDTLPVLTRRVKWDAAAPFAQPGTALVELERIVMRCLMKSRDARYANVLELARDLAKLAPPHSQHLLGRIAFVSGDPTSDDTVLAPGAPAADEAAVGERTAVTAPMPKPTPMPMPMPMPTPIAMLPSSAPPLVPMPMPVPVPVPVPFVPQAPESAMGPTDAGKGQAAIAILAVTAVLVAVIALVMLGSTGAPRAEPTPASSALVAEPASPGMVAAPAASPSAAAAEAPPPASAAGAPDPSADITPAARAHAARSPARPRASSSPSPSPSPSPVPTIATPVIPSSAAPKPEPLPKALGGRI